MIVISRTDFRLVSTPMFFFFFTFIVSLRQVFFAGHMSQVTGHRRYLKCDVKFLGCCSSLTLTKRAALCWTNKGL